MRDRLTAFAAAAVAFGLAHSAWAADVATRAPAAKAFAAAAPYNWTGFYIGGNVGGSWADAKVSSNLDPNAVVPGSGSLYGGAGNIAVINAIGTGSLGRSSQFTGGAQIGYNWQVSPSWLVGLEADFNSFNHDLSLTSTGLTTLGAATQTNSVSTDWLATVRGRAGLTFDRLLIYVTGGVAFTDLTYAQVYSDVAAPPGAGSSSVKSTKTGWTVGGGGEWAFLDHWSVKAEYLYANFGGLNTTTLLCAGGCATFSQNLGGATSDLHVHIARVGLNYQFTGQ